MALEDKYKKDEMQKERRQFLKKTMYTAPTIVALGGLVKPRKANAASDDFEPSPSDPTYANDTWTQNNGG